VHGDALYIVAGSFDLAGMQATTNLNVERANSLGNRARATYGTSRTVESGEKSVSKRSNFAAPVTHEFTSHRRVMSGEQIVPALVTHLLRPRGRAHNVC
jgi:hypothetical protein